MDQIKILEEKKSYHTVSGMTIFAFTIEPCHDSLLVGRKLAQRFLGHTSFSYNLT